ncbi:MAG: tetratricopeptide repeat protein [Elusimicrobiota bacterium]
MPERREYPPIFSKKYPLSTPVSFWASMLGMRRLATDIVWLQAIQYYGQPEGKAYEFGKNSKLPEEKILYPKLKNYWKQIIRFDPYFVSAYLIGPTTLAWNLKRYDEAFELLTESIRVVENLQKRLKNYDIVETDKKHPLILGRGNYFEELRWKLYILKSSLTYMHRDEYGKAIQEFEKIVFEKDAPVELRIILAQLYEENSEYKKALKLWELVYKNSPKKSRRSLALKNINRLKDTTVSD